MDTFRGRPRQQHVPPRPHHPHGELRPRREPLLEKCRQLDLDRIFFDASGPEADSFVQAIDYLLEHHSRLKQEGRRGPIFIPARC